MIDFRLFFFFFSSRRRHTRSDRDWSSDVCSSDLTLFTIAQDLTKMQVYASTDESDVGVIHTGQIVSFKVDAFPKDTFTGRVSQVRLNATTVQNVVTYNTIIDFDNPEMK